MTGLIVKGDWSRTKNFLKNVMIDMLLSKLDKFGKAGVEALAEATPKRTGFTASSWGYTIEKEDRGVVLTWTNTNINKWANIAILLDTGHGTKNGFYIQGRNYISPAIDPIIEEIMNSLKEEVSRL